MNKILLVIRSVIIYCVIGILGIICFVPCFLVSLLPERWRYNNPVYYWATDFFYRGIVFASGVKVSVTGRSNIPRDSAIIIANHQSAFDIPLVGFLLHGYPHVWLFLKRYTKYPIFGFIMRRMNIVVDHTGVRKLTGSIYRAVELLKDQKRHVVLFPEGGRFIDGVIHDFFYGFSLLAEQTKRPVIPIVIKNVNKAYPPGSFLLYPYPITIVVGKPFVFEEHDSQKTFLVRVHTWFAQQLEQQGS